MKLDELHINEFRPSMVGEGVSITGVFPAIARDFVCFSYAARCEDNRLRRVDFESPFFAFISEGTGDAFTVFEQGDDGVFHVHLNALMDTVVLQGTDHLQSRPVADVCEARVLMSAEVALEDAAFCCPVEERAPCLQFAHAFR